MSVRHTRVLIVAGNIQPDGRDCRKQPRGPRLRSALQPPTFPVTSNNLSLRNFSILVVNRRYLKLKSPQIYGTINQLNGDFVLFVQNHDIYKQYK